MRIIPRNEWGARFDNGAGAAPMPASEVWLHHSVTAARDGAGIIREIEGIGEGRFGSGISYTWLITPNGDIYEGHSPNRMGTHTAGRNSIARAICLVGNYEIIAPTDAQIESVAWLLRHAKANGWIGNARLNGGHRDLKATACPGAHAYAAIPNMNARASQKGFLMALSDQEQRDLYNRVFGFLRQRWFRPDPETGNILETTTVDKSGVPGWYPCAALDTADGHYIVGLIRDLTATVVALKETVEGLQ